MNRYRKKLYFGGILCFLLLLLAGCAAKVEHGFVFDAETKIKIGDIKNTSKQQADVDAEGLLRSALEKALSHESIYWDGSEKNYTLNLQIINYEMGNAFKRWLLPFYGSTVLNIEGELFGPNGTSVSKFAHKRSIAAGGLYTVGAWKTIFNGVARDIAVDLKRRMTDDAPGFYVELAPWLENETETPPKADISKKIQLLPFEDKRAEKYRIGERHAAFNVSMGNVYLNRQVIDYINEAIQNELLASGNQLISEGDKDIQLTGEIIKFWVWTETTPLYWDLKSEVEIALKTLNPNSNKVIAAKSYSAQSSARTYVWPTQKLATEVLSESIKNLMYNIRKEGIWLKES